MSTLTHAQAPSSRRRLGLVSVLTTLAMALSLAFVSSGSAQGSGSGGSGASGSTLTTVAHSPQGRVASTIAGATKSGNKVTGTFTPLHFKRHNGHVRVRGIVDGVIHKADGTTKTFTVIRGFRVKDINGTKAVNGRTVDAKATCKILHLDLAPLDLDLLGLQVHLDRVVLDIVAKSGAGQLLGNLLCSVVHLLDGGLGGQLGQLVDLLNQLLGKLLMGL